MITGIQDMENSTKTAQDILYLIVGRSGAGKDYFSHLLEQGGLKLLKSYATRLPRYEGDNDHIYIKWEDIDKYPDKIATTVVNDNFYFSTKQQINENDIYIIDPNGVKELTKNLPNQKFKIIYLTADTKQRKEQAMKRGADAQKEAIIFNSRNMKEDAQFSEFEQQIQDKANLPDNVLDIQVITNHYQPNELEYIAAEMITQIKEEKEIFSKYDLLNKIASISKMDSWFSLDFINPKDIKSAYVLDIEENKSYTLNLGVNYLVEDITENTYQQLSSDEKKLLKDICIEYDCLSNLNIPQGDVEEEMER